MVAVAVAVWQCGQEAAWSCGNEANVEMWQPKRTYLAIVYFRAN